MKSNSIYIGYVDFRDPGHKDWIRKDYRYWINDSGHLIEQRQGSAFYGVPFDLFDYKEGPIALNVDSMGILVRARYKRILYETI